jgi:hypothetical protein
MRPLAAPCTTGGSFPKRSPEADGSARTLEEFIEAFEAAQAKGPADIGLYLPEPRHALFGAVLGELIRIDLEYLWKRGTRRLVESYRARFPQVFADRQVLQGLAFEEYRLRRQAGESPSPAEYLERFGFAVGIYPRPRNRPAAPEAPECSASR